MNGVGSLGEYLTATRPATEPEAPAGPMGAPYAPEQYRAQVGADEAPAAALPPPELPQPSPTTSRFAAGSGLVAAVLGAGVGALIGGGWGAAAGLLTVGALRNSVRAGRRWSDADPALRVEARKSAAMAVVGLGAAGYFSYRAYQARSER